MQGTSSRLAAALFGIMFSSCGGGTNEGATTTEPKSGVTAAEVTAAEVAETDVATPEVSRSDLTADEPLNFDWPVGCSVRVTTRQTEFIKSTGSMTLTVSATDAGVLSISMKDFKNELVTPKRRFVERIEKEVQLVDFILGNDGRVVSYDVDPALLAEIRDSYESDGQSFPDDTAETMGDWQRDHTWWPMVELPASLGSAPAQQRVGAGTSLTAERLSDGSIELRYIETFGPEEAAEIALLPPDGLQGLTRTSTIVTTPDLKTRRALVISEFTAASAADSVTNEIEVVADWSNAVGCD